MVYARANALLENGQAFNTINYVKPEK